MPIREESNTNRKAFAFYRSFMDAIETIPDELKKARAYKVIVEYGLNGIEPTNNEDLVIKVIFKQAKPQIDANINRYDACVENGKKGGAPKGNNNASKKQPKSTKEQPENNQKTTLKDKDKVKDKDKDKVKDKERDKSLYEQNAVLRNLSQEYPKIIFDYENIENFELNNYDFELIERAIAKSEYLQQSTLSYIINHYEKVITDFYKTFKENNIKQNFDKRKYDKSVLDSLYTDLDTIEI